jgi:cysteine desulfurase/selenocysteine lyase
LSIRKLDADVLISSNYKWMNAGFGTGVMYVSDSFLSRYTPKIAGFNSYTMEADRMYYVPSARSFEPGHLNIAGLLLLETAIKEKLVKGLGAIEAHNTALTRQLLEMLGRFPVKLLGDTGAANRSSIVIIKDENGLGKHLEDNGVIVTHRGGFLRISMHFYNTAADIGRVAECLQSFYKS